MTFQMLVPEMSEARALPALVFAMITTALTGRQLDGLADTYRLRFSGILASAFRA